MSPKTRTNKGESDNEEGSEGSDDDSLQELMNRLSTKRTNSSPMTRAKRSRIASDKCDSNVSFVSK